MAKTPKIDEIDKRILRQIAGEGRISVQALGEAVGLSATPVARRLKRLEEQGFVTGYAALINEAALGFDVSVFVSVKLDRQIDNALSSFEIAIASFPEVVDCWLMTGSRDYLLRVVTGGMADFEQFLVGRLTKVKGVAEIESSIPLRRVKSAGSRVP
ncbi:MULTISPECIES: Lrp/AsnC family transcriptional regulator [unclassified Sulfitobacter]|uniref:Lrp/AsnC family transcriptional regulator n=1 Tax=unclassified Sulfitobacter TaxID=196795 RepID=UPI0007C3C54D|nr:MULTISPECIES: Lrp/AsnC family transcriptional regulator [unclassified Sulfitobacter]MAM23884.1 Lrp/AsnC family transcriptional regulator [Paracoccaceae bacterium]KZY05594.1 AsnC family transcriptional regulator [Sulfitobacter sp. HI0023]KZY24438.1 AsnC family transcriptional regulator [Sulfitobacter sp. HI0040]KZZ68279.1 AsnC family transcriptional regulator [Sulfitobacter sp. HI0129]MBO28904.1 Lrp/AsnC family transcriptional regulator [Paracoccaceae bacterium]